MGNLSPRVIPGRDEVASYGAQLRPRESILAMVVLDSGPTPRGASGNDEEIFRKTGTPSPLVMAGLDLA